MLPPFRSTALAVAFFSSLLITIAGCGGSDGGSSPKSDSGIAGDGGNPDANVPDSSTDGGTPDGSTEGGADAGTDADGSTEAGTGCTCDVTVLCDTGCACDIACSITPGGPPIGHDAIGMDRAEIAAFYPAAPGNAVNRVRVFDDGYTGSGGLPSAYPSIFAPATRPDMTPIPVSFADDVDDDGRDEPVLVEPSKVTVEDWDGTTLTPRTVYTFPTAVWWDGAAGDLDDDGGRELVVSHQVGTTVTIDVLDVGTTGTATVRATTTVTGARRHAITVGRDNPTATPEIFVLIGHTISTGSQGTEKLEIKRFKLTGTTLTEGTSLSPTSDCYIQATDPATVGLSLRVGNIDQDPESEIVVASYCKNTFTSGQPVQAYVRIVDPGSSEKYSTQTGYIREIGPGQRPLLATGRVGFKLTDPPGFAIAHTRDGSGAPYPDLEACHLSGAQVICYKASSAIGDGAWITGLAVRDLNRDGIDEIVVAKKRIVSLESSSKPCDIFSLFCTDYDSGSYVQVYKSDVSATPKTLFDTGQSPVPLTSNAPVVAVGDFDRDSIRVRATGKVYQHVGPPFVNAVLAAPPTWIGVPGVGHTDGSETSFGVTNSSGTADSANISASAGVTISAGVSILVFDLSAAVSTTISAGVGLAQEQTLSFGQETSVGPDSDLVLYRVVAYASHEYQVVSDPDPTLIGSLLTVDVPLKMLDTVRTLDQFRTEYGQAADAVIPPTLFKHTVGDPTTYPAVGTCTDAAIQTRIGAGAVSKAYESPTPVDVGSAGSGAKTQAIGMGTQTTSSVSVGLDVEMSVGAAVVVGADVSVGVGAEYTHETSVGKDVSYTGSVGYISQGYGPTTRYEWGLCVYHFADDATNPKYGAYPVIDYTVTPY